MRTLLEQQYAALSDWLDEVDVSAHLAEPVGLGDWTVRDLIAHLGLGIGLSRFVTTAPEGAEPLGFGAYVAAYPPHADQIAADTRAMRDTYGADVIGGFRRTAAEAFAALDATPGAVLQARRGPIARDDYLLTRLTELVVHADDLARTLGRDDAPLLPAAVDAVAGALATAYPGEPPDVGLTWIRLATGRVASDDPALPLL
ncbi:maleylpyruvate isomerase family mycothiol-dependent enzyme [Nocardioides anomalus]|uniref:Maleylpyruvate isomerase family mycothiol-dependent enzyme n=1 Tax=Nocardioides anomalus TaxID=2712223 RepID=A0A6G6WAN6_9ACTN|nr:maleylpyruvate isomerase family mycothiol-dependent enzyme [Nocardioides anomalus]QIG42100.1 maleylpyruvate isomerase family mycothiol-dependent enzyme [Nocardioides anomalus]